jgi:hypothetical protein
MDYTFDLLGVSPILDFFNHQQALLQRGAPTGSAYVGAYECKLDTFLRSIEEISSYQPWNIDDVVDTVIHYWLSNEENVRHWQERLLDAGKENLLVARVADFQALKAEFESLIG